MTARLVASTTMARLSGRAGPWGNFLDATLDRVADGCVFGALVLWAAATGNPWTTAAARRWLSLAWMGLEVWVRRHWPR